MSKRLIYLVFFISMLGLTEGRAQDGYRLQPISGADGVFRTVIIDGVTVYRSFANRVSYDPYMYFRCSELPQQTVYLEVTYKDIGYGIFGVEYNSMTADYQIAETGYGNYVQGTGRERTAVFELTNADFRNAQNLESDLRLFCDITFQMNIVSAYVHLEPTLLFLENENPPSLSHKAVRFDAPGDFLEVPHSATIAPLEFTIELWFKVHGLGNPLVTWREQTLLHKPGRGNDGYNIRLAGTQFPLGVHALAQPGAVWTAALIKPNVWYHLAAVKDSDSLKMYFNGLLANYSGPGESQYPANTRSPLRIGEHFGYPDTYLGLRGSIDELRIWNHTRSQSEIVAGMHERLSGNEQGLAAYWDFDELVDGAVADLSPNGNDAILHGQASLIPSEVGMAPPPPIMPDIDVIGPNLVGWWKFDKGSGTTAIDSSGNGLDMSLHNTTWEDGVFGGALHFHGAGYGYVENFDYSDNAITVCAWVRHDAFRIGEIERYVTVAEEVAVIRKDLDGSLHFYIKTDGNLQHLLVGDVLREGQWHHVVGTWDGATQRLHIDGVEIASQVLSGVLGNTLHVEMSSGGEPFNGMLDDVRIYNRALKQNELQVIMQGEEFPYAYSPTPPDGSVLSDTNVTLSWSPGRYAVSHDTYFGESFDDVYEGSAEVFQGNQTSAHFGVGLPGFPYPYGLVPGTTYYWRIDEVNALHPDSPWIGEVWSFSVPSETASTRRHFEITYYDNYNYDTGRWDAWQSAATPLDAWDDKYLANGLSGNTVFTDHAFTSITVFDLRGGLFSKDGHASGGEDWNPLQSIGDTASGQSAHHVFAALFEGLIYLEEGDVLAVASDDDVYVFLDGDTRWGREVLSVPAVSFFDSDSMIVTATQAGYHMMTVKYIERLNDHSGIEITLNGEPLRSAEIEHLVTVPGTACVFFAGQDPVLLAADYPRDRMGPGDHDNFHHDATLKANTMPPSIEVSSGATLSLSASGVWGHCPGCTSGPDGVDFYDDTHNEYVTLGGISRAIAPLNTLVGVFLTDESPDPRARPMSLFPGADMTTPELQQAFAIGSGLEYVTVPEGATRLFFGHNDGYCWNDNVGSVEVAVVFDPPLEPEPPDERTTDEGFDVYLDGIAPNIIESSWITNGILDYHCQDGPASGDFCIYWTGADLWNSVSFRFSPVKDLSVLVDEGYVVDFWVRCDSPNARILIRFMDTNTDDPDDHPWRIVYPIDRNVAVWDGRWNHLQIPLGAFYEQGSHDFDDGRWYDPVGAFDWTATEHFEIMAEYSDLEGIHLYFDDIRVVASSPTRRRR